MLSPESGSAIIAGISGGGSAASSCPVVWFFA